MKQILVYGDSLSWGIIPGTRQRLPFHQRWPGILENQLIRANKPVRVFEHCLNGRRTTTEDPIKEGRNGLSGIGQVVETCSPLDLVIIFLGTNDFQVNPSFSATNAAEGVAQIVHAVRCAPIEPGMMEPPILVVAPPRISEPKGIMSEKFQGASARCDGLSEAYQAMCHRAGCHFFDAASIVQVSVVDGVHIDSDQHYKLGLALEAFVNAKVFG